MNIFIVDDTEFHLRNSIELVKKACEKNGISKYQIIECRNGKEFLQLAKTTAPDIVLLDINMPELDGLSTLVRYRKLYPDLKTKIVMVSSETKLLIKRFKKDANKVHEDEKKQELLNKVIERVQSCIDEPGKINSVLEACASLDLDPITVAREWGANAFIHKPYEVGPTSLKLASLMR